MAKADTEKTKAKGKTKPKPKLSNKERHKRFVDMAHEVEADESSGSFDLAFKKVLGLLAPAKK
jgi:hypothetical protein